MTCAHTHTRASLRSFIPFVAARAAVSDAARAELQELQAKYDVLLEMLGEREEEVDEARAELEEVRESFRAQLLTLMHSSPTSA
ncbi:hypothetical protein EON67_08225 [archaeon]|nr:MAG: hypothetical protein EON67_08225 [archaeon]